MDLQKLFDNLGTISSIICAVPIVNDFLRSKFVLSFFEDIRLRLSPWAYKIEKIVLKNKTFINSILKLLGIGSFGICIVGATCVYLLGAKIGAILIFIILGLILKWFYGKVLIIA